MLRTGSILLLVAGMVIVVPVAVLAQKSGSSFAYGVQGGFLLYQGDLAAEKLGSFRTQKPALSLFVAKQLNLNFSIRAQLVFGKLTGDDALYDHPAYRKQRNFNFSTPLTEFTGQLVWNITGRNDPDRGFLPYVFAGAGLARVSIKTDSSRINRTYFNPETSELWIGLAADVAHKLPRIIPAFPLGAGVKYFFRPGWAVNAEFSYRYGTTDYLDGFSKAANPDRKDNYLGYAIGIVYHPGKKSGLGCPVLRQ